jgi:hypothetical protein
MRCKYCLQLSEQASNESEPSADAVAERTEDGFHGFTFALSPIGGCSDQK